MKHILKFNETKLDLVVKRKIFETIYKQIQRLRKDAPNLFNSDGSIDHMMLMDCFNNAKLKGHNLYSNVANNEDMYKRFIDGDIEYEELIENIPNFKYLSDINVLNYDDIINSINFSNDALIKFDNILSDYTEEQKKSIVMELYRKYVIVK